MPKPMLFIETATPILFGVKLHWQLAVATHEVRTDALGRPNHFDVLKTRHDLFPQDAQLHLRQAVA